MAQKTGKVTELAGTVTAESVDTNNMKRDDHLKNADFFDVSNYPELSFNLRKHNLSTSKMLAEITLLGITKPVLFNAEVSEVIKHPFSNDGKMIQAIILEGIIKRSDFGFGKKYADKIISEKIVIQISLEGRKK